MWLTGDKVRAGKVLESKGKRGRERIGRESGPRSFPPPCNSLFPVYTVSNLCRGKWDVSNADPTARLKNIVEPTVFQLPSIYFFSILPPPIVAGTRGNSPWNIPPRCLSLLPRGQFLPGESKIRINEYARRPRTNGGSPRRKAFSLFRERPPVNRISSPLPSLLPAIRLGDGEESEH